MADPLLATVLARVAGETDGCAGAATAAAWGQADGAGGAVDAHPLPSAVASPVPSRIRAEATVAR
jgi:hypothetical protein